MGTPVGYVLVDVVDDCANVAQVSVDPTINGPGAAARCWTGVRALATSTGKTAVTLTTFHDLPVLRPPGLPGPARD